MECYIGEEERGIRGAKWTFLHEVGANNKVG